MSQAAVYTFDEDCFSDLHKDAMGFRPNTAFWEWLREATDAEKQAEWDSLVACLVRREEERVEEERANIAAFEATVASIMQAGAKDRNTVIRWLMESDDRYNGDDNFAEYLNGLPYGYIKRTTN